MTQVDVEVVSGGHWLDVMEKLVQQAEEDVQVALGVTPDLSLVSVGRNGLALTRASGEPVMYEYSASFEIVGKR